METALLFAQTIATGLLAAWLGLGVRDNLFYPVLNATYTAQVMSMSRMRMEYPAEFALVAHRAINDTHLHKMAFRTVLCAEIVATAVLAVGTLALAIATIGVVDPTSARGLALVGTTLFTAIWGGFLVIGNHFSYWFCHEGAQNTHYMMTLWGLGTMVLLAQG